MLTGRPRGSVRGSTRTILAVFAVLTAVATVDLFGFAAHSQGWFAWTIRPPLSAAFVGAGYGAGFVLMVSSLRATSWAAARLPVCTVLVFATLTLVATLSHLTRFHFQAGGGTARFAAWFWLAIYLLVPVALAGTVVNQTKAATAATRRARPMPRWLAAALTAQGLLILATGVVLFVGPTSWTALWAWPLPRLTAQMIAAWLIALGFAALLAVVERDLVRLRVAAVGYATFAALQLLAVLRYRAEVDWHTPAAPLYVAVVVSVLATGIIGWRFSVVRTGTAPGSNPAQAGMTG